MKKLLAVVLALVMIMSFAACGTKKTDTTDNADSGLSTLKVGLITLHDDSSTYDKNFIDSMYRALELCAFRFPGGRW